MSVDQAQAPRRDPAGPEAAEQPAGERVSESAASRFGGWLRHAPAERAPLVGIPAVWTAAEVLHAAGVSGIYTGAAAAFAAVAGYGLGERRQRGPHKRLAGAEVAAATAAVGGWVTWATVAGPLAGPGHLLTLVYGVGAAGGYWWLRAHDAVRDARARRDAEAAAEAEAAAKRTRWHLLAARIPGMARSHLLRWEPNNNGETWIVDTYSTGRLASQIGAAELAQRLAGEMGIPRRRIEVTADDEWVYQLRILVRDGDPWQGGNADAFLMHPWHTGDYDPAAPFADLVPPAPSIRDLIVVGVDPELGTPLDFPLVADDGAQRVLVVATSGEGKSNLLDVIRERVTACRDARLFQINLSKGVEDAWWEALTEASALATDPDPDAKAQAILDYAMASVENRPRAAARKAGARQHQISDDEPLNVLVVDEADKAQADPERKLVLERLASKCRSEGWALVLASQRPLGQWISPNLRANLSWIVWSKMRASDLAKAGGSDGFTLPDMGAYGAGNKGIFGSCQLPVHEGSPYKRGRTFFWGNDSAGMLRLIRARAAGRERYRLEPALAAAGDRLAQLWAAITGAGPMPDDDRYDLTTSAAGDTVPGLAGPRAKFARAAALLDGAAAEDDEDAADDEDDDPAGPGPAAGLSGEAQAVLAALRAAPGGLSVREAAGQVPWAKTKVHVLIGELRAAGLARQAGEGRTARFVATPPTPAHPLLRIVPDPAEDVS